VKLDYLEKKFSKETVDDIAAKLYNLDWITNCVKEKVKLNPDAYKIDLASNIYKVTKRRATEDTTIDQYYVKKKKISIGVKKEDFFPIQEKKEENTEEEAEKEKIDLTTMDNTETYDTIDQTSVVRRGFNDRLKVFLSQESIETLETKSENLHKTNNELFDDIWQRISNLKKEGRDDDIFSQKSNSYDSDDNISVISMESTSSRSSSTFSRFDPSKFAINQTNKENLNEHITNELEKIRDYHQNEGNVFESLAYRKAIAQIKNSTEKITSCDQLKSYKYLGKSIGKKIKEILLTGKLGKTDYLKDDERNNTLKLLTGVWGIGMGLANKLYRKNIKTIEDLRKNQDLLNKNQLVGLKYYEEIKQRIPRTECEEVLALVKEELYTILPEELFEVQLCGSYRRGKETCGDMDILITRKDEGGIEGILQTLVDKLMSRDLITDILQVSNVGYGRNTFMGISKLDNRPHRRLDIKTYQKEFYPFALLYFTGSAYFNRSMRLFASKVGYNLSDLGLYKVNGFRKNKVPTGTSIVCANEEEIFKVLGLDYKTPSERDI
jgi:DNA polymerase/3'-5' exonuclease PolX